MLHKLIVFILFTTVTTASWSRSPTANPVPSFYKMKNSGILVTGDHHNPVPAKQAQQGFIPASTIKVLTAWLALQQWSPDYRFTTDFYYDKASETLWVKGHGDPYLVSDELRLIAKKLKELGITNIKTLGLDNSLYAAHCILPGTEDSTNPYDAVPGALAVNFNSISVRKKKHRIIAGEPETPLTAIAIDMTKKISPKKANARLRFNTGFSTTQATAYFSEVFLAILAEQGIKTDATVVNGAAPALQDVLYTHANSKTLAENITAMLKFSNNFIANQLILNLTAEQMGRGVQPTDVHDFMHQKAEQHFIWQGYHLEDGAGLSHNNRLSPQQLTELLEEFRPWIHLMPEKTPGILAKTGTLRNVKTLAGYFKTKQQQWEPFAFMINQSTPYDFRERLAKALRQKITQPIIVK